MGKPPEKPTASAPKARASRKRRGFNSTVDPNLAKDDPRPSYLDSYQGPRTDGAFPLTLEHHAWLGIGEGLSDESIPDAMVWKIPTVLGLVLAAMAFELDQEKPIGRGDYWQLMHQRVSERSAQAVGALFGVADEVVSADTRGRKSIAIDDAILAEAALRVAEGHLWVNEPHQMKSAYKKGVPVVLPVIKAVMRDFRITSAQHADQRYA